MRLNIALIFFQLTVASAIRFHNFRESEVEQYMQACQQIVTAAGGYGEELYCFNTGFLGSFLVCGYDEIAENLGNNAVSKFEHYVLKTCPNIPSKDYLKELLATTNANLGLHSEVPPQDSSAPVQYDSTVFRKILKEEQAKVKNTNAKIYFGYWLLAYWLVLLALGVFTNVFRQFAPVVLLHAKRFSERLSIPRLFKKYIGMPALVGKNHAIKTQLGGVIPTRIEFSSVLLFFFSVVIGMSVGYSDIGETNTQGQSVVDQVRSAIALRAASSTLFMVPLIFLFGTRNNVMMYLTGWKQSTFIALHKGLARTVVCLIMTHAICMIKNFYRMKIASTAFQLPVFRWGAVALSVALSFLVQSFSWLRYHYYDIFLYTHIALAIVFIISVWQHIRETEYIPFLYATLAIWLFDRAVRIVKIATFGMSKATIYAMKDEVLRVVVPRPSTFISYPGAYAYVYFIHSPKSFWQSHPFTLVDDDNGSLHFYIKVKNGITADLYRKLLEANDNSMKCNVLIEGPYGTHQPMSAYDYALLYTGGNGIPGPYHYIKELCGGSSNTKFVKFYWVVRHWYSLEWFYNELQSLAMYKNLHVIVYVTKYDEGRIGSSDIFSGNISREAIHLHDLAGTADSEAKTVSDIDENMLKIKSLMDSLTHVEFRSGRADFESVVAEDLEEVKGSNVAVMTCAHPTMCDDIRNSVAKQVTSNKDSVIDLYEELQVW